MRISSFSWRDIAAGRWLFAQTDRAIVCILLALFGLGVLRQIQLPGLYMDAANPDYLAARTLNPGLANPMWIMPTAWFPILGSLYHGVENFYVGLPIFGLLGLNIVSIRLSQALFGAGIVILLFFLSMRVTGNRLLSFLAAAGLSTDVAFLASFRTQFFIILSGDLWLFGSLLLLFPPIETTKSRNLSYFISGVCYGLAVYAYFVFLFFFPAIVWLVLRANVKKRTTLKFWIIGFVVGVMPYVAGYLSLIIALNGIHPTLEFLKSAVSSLNPLSSTSTIWGNVAFVFYMTHLALINTGNELMIFGVQLPNRWAELRFWMVCLTSMLGVFLLLMPSREANSRRGLAKSLVLLPCFYLLVCALVGTRLWVHHFSVLVPVSYLIMVVVFQQIVAFSRSKFPQIPALFSASVLTVGIIVIVFNLRQQGQFFEYLDLTGGVGKSSSATTVMAEEALAAKHDTLYVFPEWGFFIPFNFLTGNRVPYELELTANTLHRHRSELDKVRVAFWDVKDTEKYLSLLEQVGLHALVTRIYQQRDGQAAFFMVEGRWSN